MDMRDEVAWRYQHEDADEEGSYVQGHDNKPVELYRNGTYIVGLGIELDDSREVLQGKKSQADDVAQ